MAAGPSDEGPGKVALPGGIFHQMPPVGAPEQKQSAKGRTLAPLRIPIGEQKLNELKRRSRRAPIIPDPSSVVVPEAKSSISAPAPSAVLTNCSNIGTLTGWAPSDSHGAVGMTNMVTVKNVEVGVYAKSDCALVSRQDLKSFFAPTGVSSSANLVDPRVLFDRGSGRFFLTTDSFDGANSDQFQYYAVSKDGTGTNWFLYKITLSKGSAAFCKSAVSDLWDYPSAGLSHTRWFVAANDFGGGGAILSIDKAASLIGGSVAVSCFNKLPYNLAPPVVLDTSTVAQFLSPGSGGGSIISRLNLTASPSGVGSDTLAATSTVNIPAWVAPPHAAQPNGILLDTLDGRFQSASIQSDGFIWNVHSIGLGGFSKIRLYKISMSSTATLPLSILTPTTAVGENLFTPSFATGSSAPNAPAFMTASRTIPASSTLGRATFLMFVGLNSSPSTAWSFANLGQSPSQFTDCGGPVCRWGDYSATQVDPSGSGRAWGFNQTATGVSQWDWTMVAGQISAGFLASPLSCGDPSCSFTFSQGVYTPGIMNSVLDHSLKQNANGYWQYGKKSDGGGNGVIIAFDGETANGAPKLSDETCIGGTIHLKPTPATPDMVITPGPCGSASYDEHPGYDYRAAFGTPVKAAAGGSSGQLQYNNAGVFGGVPALTWDGVKVSLTTRLEMADANQGVFIGASAGASNTGLHNVGIGSGSFNANTTGFDSTAIGFQSLFTNTTGADSTAVGIYALYFNTTGNGNTAVGTQALYHNTTATSNTAVGTLAMLNNTTGANCSAVGNGALQSNTTGNLNSALGLNALFTNTTSNNSTATGAYSQYVSTGGNNTSSGFSSLFTNSTGTTNAAFGVNSLYLNTTGGQNSGFGAYALNDGVSGSDNVAVGFNTGRGITTGSNNTILGAQVSGLPAGLRGTVILATGDGRIRADYNNSLPATWAFAAPVRTAVYVVAALPAVTGLAGARAFVTDSNGTTFAAIVAGGGTNGVPVYCDGTNWRIG